MTDTYCVQCNQPLARCRHCEEFFDRFSCSASVYLECDCPRCQGMCECRHIRHNCKEQNDRCAHGYKIAGHRKNKAARRSGYCSQCRRDVANDNAEKRRQRREHGG